MTRIEPEVPTGPTRLLRGTITNYRKTRRTSDFMFMQSDRDRMGITAVAASLAGLGGIAVGLAASAMDTSEEADLLEFDLNDRHVRAWVWLSLFKDGDQVEVVAEPMGDVWQGYGIRRISDKIVALYPHCSRGRIAHYKSSFRLWLRVSIIMVFVLVILGLGYNFTRYGFDDGWKGVFVGLSLGGLGGSLIYGIITYRITRKYMGFVKLTEGVFRAFKWSDVKNIDLPAITMKAKQPGDPGALGVLYFRY